MGEWHYVAISDLRLLPGSALEPGGRVRMRHHGSVWHGTIAAKKKRTLVFGKSAQFIISFDKESSNASTYALLMY